MFSYCNLDPQNTRDLEKLLQTKLKLIRNWNNYHFYRPRSQTIPSPPASISPSTSCELRSLIPPQTPAARPGARRPARGPAQQRDSPLPALLTPQLERPTRTRKWEPSAPQWEHDGNGQGHRAAATGLPPHPASFSVATIPRNGGDCCFLAFPRIKKKKKD